MSNTVVAVDVAKAYPVCELVVRLALGRDGVERPRLIRLGGVVGRVAQLPAGVEHQVLPAVAVHVGHQRRLVVHHLERQVLLPGAFLAGGVFVPVAGRAGEGHLEHVRPAVAVEVAGVREEVLRVALGVVRLDGVDLEFLLEIRAGLPVGRGDDVHLAVPV